MTYAPSGRVPAVTPGIFQGATDAPVISGKLPGGVPGTLAIQTSKGSEGTSHQTICITEIPESIAFLPELWCRDANFKHTRGYTLGTQGFEKDWSNFEFESIKVSRRFAIQAPPEMDENWMRQLFSPTLLDLLAERTPREFWFELIEGALCVYFPGPLKGAEDLETIWGLTAEIGERIRRECLEEEGLGRASDPGDPVSRHDAEMAAKVDWPEPPPDVATAKRAYRALASEEPGLRGPAVKLGAIVAVSTGLIALIPPILLWAVLGIAGLVIGLIFDLFFLAMSLGTGGFVYRMVRGRQIDKRALAYGTRALVDSYARSRGLELGDPRAFHAEFMRIDFPGPARFVMQGRLPGGDRDGYLVLCHDPAGGAGYHLAMVPTKTADAPTSEGFTTEVQHGRLLVYSPVNRTAGASVAGLDAVGRAAKQLA